MKGAFLFEDGEEWNVLEQMLLTEIAWCCIVNQWMRHLSSIKQSGEHQNMTKKASQTQQKEAKQQQPHKTYRFRIYPTRKQTQMLCTWLGCCCDVYNAALDERKSAYRMAGVSLSYEQQCAELPGCKEVRPELSEVPSQVLQDVVKRVDLAFDAFFQRAEEGRKPGYPRFKSRFRYDSLSFKQYGNSFSVRPADKKNRGTLLLAKLGQV
jgi:putative transposase